MSTYVYRDGARLTRHMAYQIDRLNRDFKKRWGLEIKVSSGIRLNSEQREVFLRRYTRTPNGRRVYDTRWWNGQLWYRISSAGTVAPPGSAISNHEIQGSKAAVDIRDTGADAGITVASSRRGKWIRANASKYDLVADGDSFREGWHFTTLSIHKSVPKPTIVQEDDMIINIKGIRGKRRGGLYYVSNGKATFIGGRAEKKQGRYPMFTSEKEIARLQKAIKGLK